MRGDILVAALVCVCSSSLAGEYEWLGTPCVKVHQRRHGHLNYHQLSRRVRMLTSARGDFRD